MLLYIVEAQKATVSCHFTTSNQKVRVSPELVLKFGEPLLENIARQHQSVS